MLLYPAGLYCSTPRLSSPTGNCSRGFFCPSGSSKMTTCSPGAYCNGTALASPSGTCVASQVCPPGSSLPLDCTAGFYCSTNGLSAVTAACPRGDYCPTGSSSATPLPGTSAKFMTIVALMQIQIRFLLFADAADEIAALSFLFTSTGGTTTWKNTVGWTNGSGICGYAGILCDCSHGIACHVGGIFVSANGLSKTLPPGFFSAQPNGAQLL